MVITNIGTLVSGDIHKGILQADTVIIEEGKISKIGLAGELDLNGAETTIDANKLTVTPGLIDSHTHSAVGDWTPRHRALDWMEGYLNGGSTTIISQGASHTQGRPRDAAGVKALAILGAKLSKNFRSGGVKSHSGSIFLEKGLTEDDFREMAENGVNLVAEIGGGGLCRPEDVKEMVGWARKYGMIVSVHCGGESIPGAARLWADEIMAINPDVVVHINGASTSAPWNDIEKLINETEYAIELSSSGNPLTTYKVVELCQKLGKLDRLIIGSDSPSAYGLTPTAILRYIVQISSLNKIPAEKVFAMGTGITADKFKLNTGKIELGKEADLLIMDLPKDSVADNALEAIEIGDTPSIGIIIVDGQIVTTKSRNTFQATNYAKVNGRTLSEMDINSLFRPK